MERVQEKMNMIEKRCFARDVKRLVRPSSLFIILALTLTCSRRGGAQNQTGIQLQLFADGLKAPLYVTAPPADPRVFIVEQPGRIRIVKNSRLLPTPFLDLTDRVSFGGERGLFSVAFHPQYAKNGLFYVNYTDKKGDTHIERYTVSEDPDAADPASAKLILKIDQPYANHNGGLNLFGPDGMLYVGTGDGGSGGDPHGNGQNGKTLLGKMLRLDVDHGDPYAIPADNPFVKGPKRLPEIWAIGLRNPWRFAFDPVGGLLYVADVGQNKWEEIDIVPLKQGGLNYGWNIMEGNHCYKSLVCSSKGQVIAELEYGHSDGCSITGGFVYHGKAIPSLVGHYFYADYCLGWIRSFKYTRGKITEKKEWDFGVPNNVMSFGEDSQHELYVCYQNGKVYKLVSK